MAAVHGCGRAGSSGIAAPGDFTRARTQARPLDADVPRGDAWILGKDSHHLLWAWISRGDESARCGNAAFAILRGNWRVSTSAADRLRKERNASKAGAG